MLQEVLSTTTTVSAKKQIVFSSVGKSANTTYYTVPTGRIFVGHIFINTGSGWYFKINGQESTAQGGTTPYYANMLPITLIEGSTIGTASSVYNWMFMGVEEDA